MCGITKCHDVTCSPMKSGSRTGEALVINMMFRPDFSHKEPVLMKWEKGNNPMKYGDEREEDGIIRVVMGIHPGGVRTPGTKAKSSRKVDPQWWVTNLIMGICHARLSPRVTERLRQKHYFRNGEKIVVVPKDRIHWLRSQSSSTLRSWHIGHVYVSYWFPKPLLTTREALDVREQCQFPFAHGRSFVLIEWQWLHNVKKHYSGGIPGASTVRTVVQVGGAICEHLHNLKAHSSGGICGDGVVRRVP